MKWGAAILIVAVFIFVYQLHFTANFLTAILVVISMILTSLNMSMGGRVLGAALLGVTVWGIIVGGAMVCLPSGSKILHLIALGTPVCC